MKGIKASNNMISRPSHKLAVFLLAAFIIFGAFFPLKPAQAIPVEDIPALIWNKVSDFTATLWRKAGSVAFQRTLTTALNKIAYDTATWIGSGHQGQKPLFITNPWTYLGNVGDEAAGQFLESFVNNLNREDPQNCDANYKACLDTCSAGISSSIPACYENCQKQSTACVSQNASTINATPSFNVCQPSSLAAKIKIGLGLVEQSRPQGPNCTMSEIVKNWSTDSVMRAAGLGGTGLTGDEYLRHFQDFFDPRANDLGIYVSAQADLANQKGERVATEKLLFETNKGWLDVRNIAGDSSAPPGSAERELEGIKRAQETNIGTITGDAFIDAANVFINQYAISAFNELMRSLTDKSRSGGSGIQTSLRNPFSDPGAYYGISSLKDVTTKLLQPNFGVRTDYDILSSLVICPDPKNPGPDNCVIDDQFMQAISEKKTVAEALEGNYLHGEWQLTDENLPSTYNLRNLSILRKYRVVSAGWEEAVRKIVAVNPPKKATLNDLVSCFSNTDKYTNFSAEFDQRDQSWCAGLIDPNWVLKAPLNYCRQEGIGGHILNKTIIPGAGEGFESQLSIIRSDKYCADNQTCIKEKTDGSCEAYGYCNEEKRTWNFGTDTCEPINNTCQAFTSTSGESVAYLQNTLDYSSCNSETAGCRQYALSGTYNTENQRIEWSPTESFYFDKNLASCNSSDEGCTGLLRVKPTWGSNLVMNANFDNDTVGDVSAGSRLNDWPLSGVQGEIVNAAEEPGGLSGKAIKMTVTGMGGGLYSSRNASLLPANLETISGQAYTLSADVYLVNGTNVRLIMGSDPSSPYTEISTMKGKWQRLSITRPADSAYLEPSFAIFATGPAGTTVYVTNIKFEMGNWDTGYSPYGSYKVFEKIVPTYLEKSCYIDAVNGDFRFKADAPAACSMFARKCNKSEVGCESYLSSTDNFRLSGQVTSADYCSSQCLGYDEYIAKQSYFSSPSPDKIIPQNTRTCAAAAVGCTEFTNLDNLAQGGETKEYYTSLKQCIKPSTTSCATFYTWEGTGSGYQLKAYSLKKAANGLPAVTSNDASLCNATIYRLPVTDPGHNPDCREYYNAAGQVAYHLNSRTITCSENCHAYRMTEKNIDRSLTASQCTGTDKYWDASALACNVCQNGGTWDNARKACIYQAIPGEGQSCKAAETGCREYNGSRGSNVKLQFAYDYEAGLSGWYSNCSGGVTHSTVSNNNNGHSLQYNNNVNCANAIGHTVNTTSRLRIIEQLVAGDNLAAQINVAGSVKQGSAYTLKFIARSAANISLKIFFLNPETNERSYFNGSVPLEVKGGNEWNIYQVNLGSLDHPVSANEVLAITANGTFNLDDLVMSEITDRYYLIKGSSVVPSICSYDIFDNYQGDEYNLGCSEYTDRAGQKHNLHRFSSLCSESAVGCEQMIDTKNYSPYQAGYWLDGQPVEECSSSDKDCLVVPADSASYAVFDNKKLCTAGNQGCSRLGEGQGGANLNGWADVYKKNNPDQYSSTLCGAESVGCEEWRNKDNGQSNYFKNPGTAACIYRAPTDPAVANKSWFRVPAKRCDLNSDGVILNASGYNEQEGAECISDSDCSGGTKCVVDLNDYPCSYTYDLTFGLGGAGNQIPVPDQQVGLCDAAFSSCTEYLDPVSRAAANIVVNPSFETVDGTVEGWGSKSASGWSSQAVATDQQFIRVRPNRMYSLVYKPVKNSNPVGSVTLDFQNDVKVLQTNNQLGAGVKRVSALTSNSPVIFNSLHNDFALVDGGEPAKLIEVKEIMMGYQLESKLDKTSCNGLVDFDNGCILFNERSINGASGLADLSTGWDPFLTKDNNPPQVCATGSAGCAANELVKVRPDRVCSKWVDCISFIQDPYTKNKTCYAFAECDRLDDKGECANYISLDTPENPVIKASQDSTGYTPARKYSLSDMRVVGRDIENIPGSFDNVNTPCDPSKPYCVISSPDKAKNATDYPADGPGYLMIDEGGEYPLATDLSVRAPAGEDFYINYLLSTKDNGGGSARIKIVDRQTGTTTVLIEERAESGWQRKVNSFRLTPAGLKNIDIYLQSVSGPVYFDDISIEPVLKTAPDTYSVSECRLYPTNDSLTCTSKNKNVISDGLKGYCIEKDPANPDVCLMWYPMDNIPLPTFSAMGYDGNFPLNYCSRTSGNFDLMEHRRGYYLGMHTETSNPPNPINLLNTCFTNQEVVDPNFSCPADYKVWVSQKIGDSGNRYRHFMCIPKPELLVDKLGISMVDKENANHGDSAGSINTSLGENWEQCQNVPYKTGFAAYNGFEGFEAGKDQPGYRPDPLNPDPTPNLMIRDYNRTATSYSDLRLIPGTNTSSATNYYRFTCDQVIQAIDSSGSNLMWADRVKNNTNFKLGQSVSGNTLRVSVNQTRENSPFGGFIGNISENQGVISLSDVTTGVLAGLPYGCLNGVGQNCQAIGYCSASTSVFCLTTQTSTGASSLEKMTCSGGNGTCMPLFRANLPFNSVRDLNSEIKENLKNITLQSSRSLDNVNGKYVPSSGNYRLIYNYTVDQGGIIPVCPNSTRSEGDFCLIYPKISNVKLFYNNSPLTLGSNAYDVKQKGIYRLEFNSEVDKEQQPLKKIRIDWGDGYIQTVTDQDHQPLPDNPHVFYHYYNKTGPKEINVKVIDNWGFYHCLQGACGNL